MGAEDDKGPDITPKDNVPTTGASITVPITALAMPGEDEMMNNPGVGDMVHFHVEGKVGKIEGENAVVNLETVNGKPVTQEAAKVNDTPEQDDEFEQLKSMAAQQGGM